MIGRTVSRMYKSLKPFPFCGRLDTLTNWALQTPLYDRMIEQWHVSCSMAGDNTGCGGTSGARPTKKKAIEAWNRRANAQKDGEQG